MSDVHRRIRNRKYFRGLLADEFSVHAAEIIGDLNYVHPFSDGNGRTQLHYYKQLAEQAGFEVDLTQLTARLDDRVAASSSRRLHVHGKLLATYAFGTKLIVRPLRQKMA